MAVSTLFLAFTVGFEMRIGSSYSPAPVLADPTYTYGLSQKNELNKRKVLFNYGGEREASPLL